MADGRTLDGGRPTAIGDPVRVRQILRNLITNALRYGGDSVSIRLMADEAAGRVQVIDDGPAGTTIFELALPLGEILGDK
jgi:signal transduction histidine kinase